MGAETTEHPEQAQHAPWRFAYRLLVPLTIVAAVPVALVGNLFSGFHFEPPFFEATAQVFVLLLIAMFVEIAGVQARFRRRWEEGVRHRVGEGDPELAADLQGFQQAIEGQARKMFALGVIGEAASLYAIAAGSPSEYLGSLCVLALGSFLYLMWSAFETHIAGAAGG